MNSCLKWWHNMKIIDTLDEHFGTVEAVDTNKVTVVIEDESKLNNLRINDLLIMDGNNADEKLISIITRVQKKSSVEEPDEPNISENIVLSSLVGTFKDAIAGNSCSFKRTITTYPEINSKVYVAKEGSLGLIMGSMTSNIPEDFHLKIGKFTSNNGVNAILDGNKFFQRHAAIVGSTGSGKSYTVANILEQVSKLPNGNALIFDLHGEYTELSYCKLLRIGSNRGELKIPLWFFNYEEIHSLFVESSEGTSSNQRATVVEFILEEKKEFIIKNGLQSLISPEDITVDTPIPFSTDKLVAYLTSKDTEMVEGTKGEKKGPSNGKLTNLINRLSTKISDKKYSFMLDESSDYQSITYLKEFMSNMMDNDEKKIRVLDLSGIPSDIVPVILGVTTRLLNNVQFWMNPSNDQIRNPISLFCDEAHIYMAKDLSRLGASERKSLEIFENIAKEGRKYGLGLVIISQRPSELNTTIISQCNNIMSLKVTNERDKSAIASMLTDSLAGLVDLLPNLDVGECIVAGDSIVLPTRIKLNEPNEKPNSTTIDFWSKWIDSEDVYKDIDESVNNMIKQSR